MSDKVRDIGQAFSESLQGLYSDNPDAEEMAGYLVALTCDLVFWTHMLSASGAAPDLIKKCQDWGQRMGRQSFANFVEDLKKEQKIADLHNSVTKN